MHVATTDPLGNTSRTAYDGAGRVISEVDPRAPTTPSTGDYTTVYGYDENGYLASRSVPYVEGQYGLDEAALKGWQVRFERNAVGDPTTITDARGNSFSNDFLDTAPWRRPAARHIDPRDGAIGTSSSQGIVHERAGSSDQPLHRPPGPTTRRAK